MKALLWLLAAAAFAQKLVVLPPSVDLTGPEARQQLVIEAATGAVEWSSSDPKIAAVDEHGVVRPTGDGEARITVRANGAAATTFGSRCTVASVLGHASIRRPSP